MDTDTSLCSPEKTWLSALQAMNRQLAVIKDRLEIVLMSGTPEYIRSDLVTAYKAEREISEMVHGLVVDIMQKAHHIQEAN